GLDEDCDGDIDAADLDCVPACPDADGDGYVVCGGGCQLPAGKSCGDCDDTRQGVHPGAAEACNDRDDDCDGQTDEGNPGGGASCGTGQLGLCALGHRVCEGGALVCLPDASPVSEVCTGGLDEDCDGDGQTDDGNPGGGASCSTGQQGVCAGGTRTCVDGALSCVRDQGPTTEVCTGGLDEDCDGDVDAADANCTPLCPDGDGDGYVTCSGCQADAGKTCGDCDDTRGLVHPGATETCNNRDDDCDDQTDEGNPGGGASCSTGQQGVCAAGTQTCQSGTVICVRDVAPSAEVCTGGLDEDCDGAVDAADTNCTPNCADADGDHYAVCGSGCQPPAGTTCGDCDDTRGLVHPGGTETCNNRDDDCDGQTDEGNPGGGAACSTGQQGVCAAGTQTCQSGSLACVRNQGPSAEV